MAIVSWLLSFVAGELILVIAGIALWVGSVVGAYVALRLRGFPEPGGTAIPLAVLFPFASILSYVAVFMVQDFLSMIIPVALTVTIAALGARAFARWRATGGL